MNTDFTLTSKKFNKNAEDHTPESDAECCKWYEDMLTLNHPKFNKLEISTPQETFYLTGKIRCVGWEYSSVDPIRVLVNENGSWRIRYVPTKDLAEAYIKKFSATNGQTTPIFWMFFSWNDLNTIEMNNG